MKKSKEHKKLIYLRVTDKTAHELDQLKHKLEELFRAKVSYSQVIEVVMSSFDGKIPIISFDKSAKNN